MERSMDEAGENRYSLEITQGADEMLRQSGNDKELDVEDSFKLEEIVSERMTEEIQDDQTALKKKDNKTPLAFYCRVGSYYLFSFKKQQIGPFLLKLISLLVLQTLIIIFVQKVTTVGQNSKNFITSLVVIDLLLFVMVFFIDAGTLLEDEEERVGVDRLYCQICKLYKYERTRHCTHCRKCILRYDHHCAFFGKCIGRNNYVMFCGLLCCLVLMGSGAMICLIYTISH